MSQTDLQTRLLHLQLLVAERQVVEGHVAAVHAAVAAGAEGAVVAEGVEAHAAADNVPGLPLRLSLPVPVSHKYGPCLVTLCSLYIHVFPGLKSSFYLLICAAKTKASVAETMRTRAYRQHVSETYNMKSSR